MTPDIAIPYLLGMLLLILGAVGLMVEGLSARPSTGAVVLSCLFVFTGAISWVIAVDHHNNRPVVEVKVE